MAAHSMSKQSVAAGLSVCSKPHRWNSAFISARNKKKGKNLFFSFGIISSHVRRYWRRRSASAVHRSWWRRIQETRKKAAPPAPSASPRTHLDLLPLLADISGDLRRIRNYGFLGDHAHTDRGFGLRRWARRWVTGDACVFRNGNQAGSLLWRR
jgi:hypothetical protein